MSIFANLSFNSIKNELNMISNEQSSSSENDEEIINKNSNEKYYSSDSPSSLELKYKNIN